jgi:uncharacterized membrane protein YadS
MLSYQGITFSAWTLPWLKREEISVAMGTVFLLNSVALVAFPIIGQMLRLNQNQFGHW